MGFWHYKAQVVEYNADNICYAMAEIHILTLFAEHFAYLLYKLNKIIYYTEDLAVYNKEKISL